MCLHFVRVYTYLSVIPEIRLVSHSLMCLHTKETKSRFSCSLAASGSKDRSLFQSQITHISKAPRQWIRSTYVLSEVSFQTFIYVTYSVLVILAENLKSLRYITTTL
jgi:hypothetical protein